MWKLPGGQPSTPFSQPATSNHGGLQQGQSRSDGAAGGSLGSVATPNGGAGGQQQQQQQQASTSPNDAPTSARGGGGHRSISSEFNVNPVTGTMSLSLPVYTSAGRSDSGPKLALGYDSGSGNGVFGIGWQLSTPSISRKTSKGIPRYDESDVFILSSFDDLVPVRVGDGEEPVSEEIELEGVAYRVRQYKARVETEVHRIEHWTRKDDSNDVHWRTVSPDNHTTFFGEGEESRLFDDSGEGETRIFSWLASRTVDAAGNAVHFEYKCEDSQGIESLDPADSLCELDRTNSARSRMRYLKRIRYGNVKPSRDLETWKIIKYTGDWMFEVVLDYGDHDPANPSPGEQRPWEMRQYPFSVRTGGFELRTYRLCRRILMFHRFPESMQGREYALVSSTELEYADHNGVTLLKSFQASGYLPEGAKLEDGVYRDSLPPLEFQYTEMADARSVEVKEVPRDTLHQMSSPTGWKTEWIDLDGEGAPGSLLEVPGGAWRYQRNELLKSSNPETFGPVRELPFRPNTSSQGQHYFEDLSRNGRMNVVCLDSVGAVEGYYERTEKAQGWESFQPFPSIPSVPIEEVATKRIDLTGDGLADILREETTGEMLWYRCLGKRGFAAAERVSIADDGPRLVSHDLTTQIYLADMTGDGLADIVEVLPGKISYWPNVGYGKFGRRITMGNSPSYDRQDQFSHSRLHLTDVCGSGTTDIVYLPPEGGIHVYFNLAGNRWSEALVIPNFPRLDSMSSIFTLDLLGKGTSCLCWSGPAAAGGTPSTLRYVELTGGTKPYLLRWYTNGIGNSTTVSYQPSTKYYLDDEQSGNPWTTKLPFPVHCVSQVVTQDCVAQTLKKSRYAYHDGQFDGVEREFRGFGIVEHWDEEQFGGGDAYLQRPPIRTKEWYDVSTGSDLGGRDESRLSSPANKLPLGLSSEEHYEVLRALKGQKLREEVYSDDGSDLADLPYFVGEFSYEVHRVQAAARERGGVYRVSPRESVKTVYERQQDDPRIERVITLEVNDYGDVLKSLTVHHGRQKSDLPDRKDRHRQEVSWGTYVENIFTDTVNELDCFQKPQLALTRQFAVAGVKDSVCTDIEALTANDFSYLNNMEVIPYTTIETSHGTGPRKSLVQEQRLYYMNQALSEPLEWREIAPYSVLDRTYDLVFQEGILEKHFISSNLLDERSLREALSRGGYMRLKGDARVWAPSERKLFSREAGQNLHEARRSFYQPSVTIDPFGAVLVHELDRYHYLPDRTIDAMGNVTRFENDYWHLQPSQTTDINGNRLRVAFDAFSCVIGTARMGKEHEEVGDSLQGLPVIVSSDMMEVFLQDPCGAHTREFLGKAGNRVLLYRGQFTMAQGKLEPVIPSLRAEISCDVHYRDRTKDSGITLSITYLDGSGAPLQTTTLCTQAQGKSPAQWRISEWVIKDSKGHPVRVCQPSYASDHRFHFHANIESPKTTNLLDPLDRVQGILYADHTWSKQRVTPWSTVAYDVGSTITVDNPALDPDVGPFFKTLPASEYLPTWLSQRQGQRESAAAQKSVLYSGKQKISHLDARGLAIGSDVILRDGKVLSTRQTYNVAGHPAAHYDALNRVVQELDCDLLGRNVVTRTMDAGETTALLDCLGKPLFHWTHESRSFHHEYDLMGRETELRMRDRLEGPEEVVLHKVTYGESDPRAKESNLRGRIARVQDQSGELANVRLDFKGNCVEQSYQLAANYKTTLDWGSTVELEGRTYHSYATFDALDRVVLSTDASGCQSITSYDLANNLKTVAAQLRDDDVPRLLVRDQNYAPDGNVLKTFYGNGAILDHTYDDATRRVVRKTLSRENRGNRSQVQDLHYSRDCMGRVIRKSDAAQQPWFFRNSRTDPEWTYTYDALGQLISATGREQVNSCDGGAHRLLAPGPQTRPKLGLEMCQYRETYRYDDAGNILSIHHGALNVPSIAGWTRRFEYQEESQLHAGVMGNRLTSTITGGIREHYGYGPSVAGQRGCMTAIAGYTTLTWDHMDKMRSSSRQVTRDDSARERTWYVYNMAGMRVRKVTERGAAPGTPSRKMKERVFLPGLDLYRTFAGDGETVTNEHIQSHIQSTSTTAVAILERTGAGKTDATCTLVRYQPGDSIELDDMAGLISYEEYTPFGATVLCAGTRDIEAARKYRFAGYERDRETGFSFCDHRYYAPWLGRWSSPDPLGLVDGLNLYEYVGNDPVNMFDPTGTVGDWRGQPQYSHLFLDGSRISGDGSTKPNQRIMEQRAFEFKSGVLRRTRKAFEEHGIVGLEGLKPEKPGTGTARGEKHHIMSQDWGGSFRAVGFDVHAFTLFCSKTANRDVGKLGDDRWNKLWTQVRQDAYNHYSKEKGGYKLTAADLKSYMKVKANRDKIRKDIVDTVGENLRDFVDPRVGVEEVKDLSEYMVANALKSEKITKKHLRLFDEVKDDEPEIANPGVEPTDEEVFGQLTAEERGDMTLDVYIKVMAGTRRVTDETRQKKLKV